MRAAGVLAISTVRVNPFIEIVDAGNCKGQATILAGTMTKTKDSMRTISLNPI